MTASTDSRALTLTPAAFKSKIIEFIKSKDFKAEFLRQQLSALPDDKRALFEDYRTDSTTDPISNDRYKWEREGGAYFSLQLHMAEENFCLKRLEHLIEVKSYLTERGIVGFSQAISHSITSDEDMLSAKKNAMCTDFSSVDLTGFTPSRSLSNYVNSDDISAIRIALFQEMNNKQLSTIVLNQAIAWTLSKHPNLFVAYEENAYSQKMIFDSAQWSRDYYHMQEVYSSSNFSLERICHMVAVREHVFEIVQDATLSAILPCGQSQSTPKQPAQPKELAAVLNHRTDDKPQNNVLKSLLLIGGVMIAIVLVIMAVIAW